MGGDKFTDLFACPYAIEGGHVFFSCFILFAAAFFPSPSLSLICLCRDGRLQEGDQILAIDGQLLDSNISHKQAIHILQQAKGLVEIVVARGETAEASGDHQRAASTISTDMVSYTSTIIVSSSRSHR